MSKAPVRNAVIGTPGGCSIFRRALHRVLSALRPLLGVKGLPLQDLLQDLSLRSHVPVLEMRAARIVAALTAFRTAFPQVKPFYATKCNSDSGVLRVLRDAGCGFE